MIRCAPWISWVPCEGPLALFDQRDGSYHALNGSAALIWTELNAGRQPAEIGAAIAAARKASLTEVSGDIDAFVKAALDKGLLVAE